MKILIVEDNPVITKGLEFALHTNGYEICTAATVTAAKEHIKNFQFDLAVLDIALPDGNGFQLFEESMLPSGIPALFLSAKDDEESIVKGLNIGGEDYLTKPFSTKELLARIHKILLRKQKQQIISFKNIQFDVDKMVCYKNGVSIRFSPLELKLLYLFVSNLNKTITREVLLDKIWELTGNDVDDHTVTVYMKRIREKLGTNVIQTIKGVGYRIDEK